jgi:hypothetical protein
MKDFRNSFIFTAVCLATAYFYDGMTGMALAAILGVLEVSLSFDNAVVNAKVLERMDDYWKGWFLSWGLLIAVVGMRLLFPIAIVSGASGLGFIEIADLALHDGAGYGEQLHRVHPQISAFGGVFLLMVALSYFIDEAKEIHWLQKIEEKLSHYGKLENLSIAIALAVIGILYKFTGSESVLFSGVIGLGLYVVMSALTSLFDPDDEQGLDAIAKKTGIMSALYLEVLDSAFSLDGVSSAFVITNEIVIIMLGLAIGAMFVRSMTVALVNNGTLAEYTYLEHGAHWAIAMLSMIMFVSIGVEIPELLTGILSVLFIGCSVYSSVKEKKVL